MNSILSASILICYTASCVGGSEHWAEGNERSTLLADIQSPAEAMTSDLGKIES